MLYIPTTEYDILSNDNMSPHQLAADTTLHENTESCLRYLALTTHVEA